eukprot:14646945-Ditylum_brightwellii.AAC.1
MKNLSGRPKISHVKSHQGDDNDCDDLDLPERLNVDTDSLAERHCKLHGEANINALHLPINSTQVAAQ